MNSLDMHVGMGVNETLWISPPSCVLTSSNKGFATKRSLSPKACQLNFPCLQFTKTRLLGRRCWRVESERFSSSMASTCAHPQVFFPFGLRPKFALATTLQRWKQTSSHPWCFKDFNYYLLQITNITPPSPWCKNQFKVRFAYHSHKLYESLD